MPALVAPKASYAESFRHAMDDFAAEGRGAPDDDSALGRNLREYGPGWHTDLGFRRFLHAIAEDGDTSLPEPPGWVHTSTYWWVDGPEYLGSIRLRHRLTPAILESAGHIGYEIAPAVRRRGHATAMLAETLPLAAELGIDPVLITCDVDNVASRRVIENNGGELEDERRGKLRFWVPTG